MNEDVLVQVIQFILFASLAWFGFFWFYKKLTVEFFRQKMFATRDALFDYAANGDISFDHPAYCLLRTTMNGFIRYADKLSFLQFLIAFIFFGRKKDYAESPLYFANKWNVATKGLTEHQLGELGKYHSRMMDLVAIQTMAKSPFFICIVLIAALLMMVPKVYSKVRLRAVHTIREWFSKPLSQLETTAMTYEGA